MGRAFASYVQQEPERARHSAAAEPRFGLARDVAHDLRRVYLIELQEARCMEEHVAAALKDMVEAAYAAPLRAVLNVCEGNARAQAPRLDVLLRRHGLRSAQHRDESMQWIIAAAGKWSATAHHPSVRDAGRLASFQRIAHYRVAAYEAVTFWARELRLKEDAQTLHLVLTEARQWLEYSNCISGGVARGAAPESGANILGTVCAAPSILRHQSGFLPSALGVLAPAAPLGADYSSPRTSRRHPPAPSDPPGTAPAPSPDRRGGSGSL